MNGKTLFWCRLNTPLYEVMRDIILLEPRFRNGMFRLKSPLSECSRTISDSICPGAYSNVRSYVYMRASTCLSCSFKHLLHPLFRCIFVSLVDDKIWTIKNGVESVCVVEGLRVWCAEKGWSVATEPPE